MLFISEDELPRAELRRLVPESYAGFSTSEVVPVVPLPNHYQGGKQPPIFLSELFHGPTFCFKDLGQQPLVRLLAWFAEGRGERRTMLVSTTGDTGPAAMQAVADVGSPSLQIIVFYPEGQISDLQRRQMTTRATGNGGIARVASFNGGGDDMDVPLKRLAADRSFAERHGLCGINSYNLGRPVAQMVHYFWTYFRVLDQLSLPTGSAVDIVVPCGALGNLAAGYMAREMGLPLRGLIAGVNSNDITHRTIAKGEFHRSERMEKTLSDAINIQVPYNMERLLYYLTGEDSSLIASWMGEAERSGQLTLPQQWLAKMQGVFSSSRVDDSAMCSAMRRALEEHSYLADPHTSVALAAAWRFANDTSTTSGSLASLPSVPLAVLATASPCKFEASVTAAVGASSWAAFAAGPGFPAAARQVLALPEGPCGQLRARGSLSESQAAWEMEVREMLESSKETAPKAPEGASGTALSRSRL